MKDKTMMGIGWRSCNLHGIPSTFSYVHSSFLEMVRAKLLIIGRSCFAFLSISFRSFCHIGVLHTTVQV